MNRDLIDILGNALTLLYDEDGVMKGLENYTLDDDEDVTLRDVVECAVTEYKEYRP